MVRRHLSYTEKKRVEALLLKHVETLEGGRCRYLNDATDAGLAGQARIEGIDGCTPHNVASIREEVFGSLRPKPDIERVAALEEQVEALKDHVRKIGSDLVLVMDYLTRTAGVSWTMEQYTNEKVQAAKDHLNGKTPQ